MGIALELREFQVGELRRPPVALRLIQDGVASGDERLTDACWVRVVRRGVRLGLADLRLAPGVEPRPPLLHDVAVDIRLRLVDAVVESRLKQALLRVRHSLRHGRLQLVDLVLDRLESVDRVAPALGVVAGIGVVQQTAKTRVELGVGLLDGGLVVLLLPLFGDIENHRSGLTHLSRALRVGLSLWGAEAVGGRAPAGIAGDADATGGIGAGDYRHDVTTSIRLPSPSSTRRRAARFRRR